jgi:hypothetical protein
MRAIFGFQGDRVCVDRYDTGLLQLAYYVKPATRDILMVVRHIAGGSREADIWLIGQRSFNFEASGPFVVVSRHDL